MEYDKLSWKASGEYEFISFFPGAPGHLPLHMQAQQPPPQQVILTTFWYEWLKLHKAILNNMTNNLFIMQPPPQQQQQLNQWGIIHWFLQLYCNTFWQFRRRKEWSAQNLFLSNFQVNYAPLPHSTWLVEKKPEFGEDQESPVDHHESRQPHLLLLPMPTPLNLMQLVNVNCIRITPLFVLWP